MHFAVELDHKSPFGTAEVDDKWADWMLSPKFHSVQTPAAQFHPQEIFSPSFSRTQIPSCWNIVAMLVTPDIHDLSFA